MDSKVLCEKGDKNAVLFPTKNGYKLRGKWFNWILITVFWIYEQLLDGSENNSEFNARGTVEDYFIQRRIHVLDYLVDNTKYARQNCALEKEFGTFLKENCFDRDFITAMPDNFRRFLIMRDGKGKTQVHDLIWEYLRKHGEFNCSCPVRLAAGTVQYLLWKLKHLFEIHGKSGNGMGKTSLEIQFVVRVLVGI